MAGVSLTGPSRTAVVSAVGRGLHADGPPPRVLDDSLAGALAGSEGLELLAELRGRLSDEQLASFSRWTAVRGRFVEDLVGSALADGVEQYVILGAGLDSFAYRRSDLMKRLRVVEVDHPATQSWKLQRLRRLAVAPPEGLVFVPVDFERESFVDGLEEAGFDRRKKAVVSWVGVTMYLTLEAVVTTLTSLAGLAAGSRIAITYDLPASALTGLELEVRDGLAAIVSDLGEPFVTTFERSEVESLLYKLGFANFVHFGPAEAIQLYFEGQTGLSVGGSQRLLSASVFHERTAS